MPKGTLIIRAAELVGIQVPRFCDHPLLDPIGACRQCIVEVEGQRKPVASCTVTVTEGMAIKTQLTSRGREEGAEGNLEFLLLNHPLDCPVCDKGGECPLQNQTLNNGAAESRFKDVKRTYREADRDLLAGPARPRALRAVCPLHALLRSRSPATRSSSCSNAARSSRSASYEDEPFSSYFSGNTVQICPVGALTGTQYRFRARPFDLVSTPVGLRALRRPAASSAPTGAVARCCAGWPATDAAVNEEWNCDKGRWAF